MENLAGNAASLVLRLAALERKKRHETDARRVCRAKKPIKRYVPRAAGIPADSHSSSSLQPQVC